MTPMIRHRLIPTLSALAIAATLAAAPRGADAKDSRVASYSMERAWPTVVRCLRIDLGYKIVERDKEAGYIIFEMTKGDATYRGSIELVRTVDHAERSSVKLIADVVDQPSYEDSWILDKVLARLREDLGQPIDKEDEPEKKQKKPPAKDSDEGKSEDKGDSAK